MKRHRPTGLTLIAPLVAGAFILLPTGGMGHEPDPLDTGGVLWEQDRTLNTDFSTTYPPPSNWMQDPIRRGAADWTGNPSNSPTITFSGTGEGIVYYKPYGANNPCEIGWIACAGKTNSRDGNNSNDSFRVTFVAHGESGGGVTVRWCDKPNTSGTCWDVERVALHEFGHVLHLGHPPVQNEGHTVMHHSVPTSLDPGGTTHTWKTCDKATLQLRYDVSDSSVTYANCLDHVEDAGPSGLRTDPTFSSNYTSLCYGQVATFSGKLEVEDKPSYLRLGNNRLGSRDVKVQRAPHGTGNFSTYATVSTSNQGVWSYGVSLTSFADYDWRARFAGEGTGLSPANSSALRVRWTGACG